jgi:DNA (cytosine-5)-methyltransferase 1
MRNGKVSWDTLDVAVQWTDNQSKTGGQLNPQWVEWLMGFPVGHTDLNNSETP